MVEVTSIKEMSHEDWLKLRKTGIGGSDACSPLWLKSLCQCYSCFPGQDK